MPQVSPVSQTSMIPLSSGVDGFPRIDRPVFGKSINGTAGSNRRDLITLLIAALAIGGGALGKYGPFFDQPTEEPQPYESVQDAFLKGQETGREQSRAFNELMSQLLSDNPVEQEKALARLKNMPEDEAFAYLLNTYQLTGNPEVRETIRQIQPDVETVSEKLAFDAQV